MSPVPTRRLTADTDGIATAAHLLRSGDLVAFPTETVYGLGGDATNALACAAIFEAKGRPRFNPLIVHVPDLDAARALALFSDTALALATAFWPGPLTLVLPLRTDHGLSDLVSGGLQTVAIRVPAHPVAQSLMRAVGRPLAGPSANPSGRISPTTADHVIAGLDGRIAAVLDGGACAVGLESTILGVAQNPMLLRAGGLATEDITAITGPLTEDTTPGKVQAPGQLASHYAPAAHVRLNVTERAADAVLIGFGAVRGDLTLSSTGNLREAAAHLFATLHAADAMGKGRIDVAPIPDHGLGRAINDRLARAAAPRVSPG
jgi:L-threonylcarbamoyladenylate synthase